MLRSTESRWPNRGAGTVFRAIVGVPGLSAGWMRVLARSGAPGVDGVTVEGFARGAEGRIVKLCEELTEGTYRPQPPRIVRIPKKVDGERTLRIPGIRDRVVQSSAALVLSPLLEPTFEDGSFGYRPGRSIQAAARRIGALHARGFDWVVEADIDDFFDDIPHDRLLAKLAKAIPDADVEALVALWLTSAEPDGVGIAQGSPLSPLLANLYLDAVDEALIGTDTALVRYADDFVILCRSRDGATRAMGLAIKVLGEHRLLLDAEKTRIVPYGDGFRFLGHRFDAHGIVYESAPTQLPTGVQERRGDNSALRGVSPSDGLPAGYRPDPIPDETIDDLAGHRFGRHAERLRRLYLMGKGIGLRVVGRSLVVHDGNEAVADVPPSRIDRIEVGPAAAIETEAVRHALRHGIGLDLVDGHGRTIGRIEAGPRRHGRSLLAQAACRLDETRRLAIAGAIVAARIHNQRALLHRLNRRRKSPLMAESAKAIGRILKKLEFATNVDEARGFEGAAARLYWPAFGSIFGKLAFVRRTRAGDGGPVNVVLDILSGLLRRDLDGLILKVGLHPAIGFLHAQTDVDWSLSADLVEEYRAPLIESLTAYLFNNRLLDGGMFEADEIDGVLRPDAAAYAVIIRQFEAWIERPIVSPQVGDTTTWRGLVEDQLDHLGKVLEDALDGTAVTYHPYRMDY